MQMQKYEIISNRERINLIVAVLNSLIVKYGIWRLTCLFGQRDVDGVGGARAGGAEESVEVKWDCVSVGLR